MKAIVIGAGIGGLSAAVALKQSGIDCDVYEAVKEIKPVGAAISVWPNGVKCMAHLGMGDIMETFGGPLRRMAYRDFRSGENMTQFSLAPLIERTGSRPCPVSRAELQREMLDYWGRDSVQFGKRVTRCEEDADGVTVWFYRRQQRQRRSADCRRRQPFRTASVGAGLYPAAPLRRLRQLERSGGDR
ncbi:putative flavoprotein monooxygenase [Klebsiella pneumoniae subsp. ozaenae]|uniref:Putative flavoprotein monooxygenase n=1 Tax=Klebsiella pneumoniae subsp. ozaenae TaxID=574 RepID=A0A377ZMN2_KLEPO|nr:putative flavoprotein monooxygenase [Klebsiella pneumoniae subsp. ozaenae]STV27089.1 putative flavoprotein monooxygenase [Klebsiella pneumoniae subsp. ozaenae]